MSTKSKFVYVGAVQNRQNVHKLALFDIGGVARTHTQ